MNSTRTSPRNAVLRFDAIIKWLAKDSRALTDKMGYLLANPQVAAEFGRQARCIVLADFVEKDVVRRQITAINRFSPSAAGRRPDGARLALAARH